MNAHHLVLSLAGTMLLPPGPLSGRHGRVLAGYHGDAWTSNLDRFGSLVRIASLEPIARRSAPSGKPLVC